MAYNASHRQHTNPAQITTKTNEAHDRDKKQNYQRKKQRTRKMYQDIMKNGAPVFHRPSICFISHLNLILGRECARSTRINERRVGR